MSDQSASSLLKSVLQHFTADLKAFVAAQSVIAPESEIRAASSLHEMLVNAQIVTVVDLDNSNCSSTLVAADVEARTTQSSLFLHRDIHAKTITGTRYVLLKP